MKNIKTNQDGFGAMEFLLVFIILSLLGVVGWVVYKNHNKTMDITTATSTDIAKQTTKTSNGNSSYIPSAIIPLGTSATDGVYTIKVAKVIGNPPTSGDKASTGTHYVEVDLEMAIAPNKDNIALNLQYTDDPSADQGSTTYYNTADFSTTSPSSGTPGKSVKIAGKNSVEDIAYKGTSIISNNAMYANFQVPTKDSNNGVMAWIGLDGQWRYFKLQ